MKRETAFWQNFVRLCNEHEKKPNPVAKELGISSGTVTGWKNGSAPRDTVLQKIADYFNVTTQELLKEKEKPANDGEFTGVKKEIYDIYKSLSPEKQEQAEAYLKFLLSQQDNK